MAGGAAAVLPPVGSAASPRPGHGGTDGGQGPQQGVPTGVDDGDGRAGRTPTADLTGRPDGQLRSLGEMTSPAPGHGRPTRDHLETSRTRRPRPQPGRGRPRGAARRGLAAVAGAAAGHLLVGGRRRPPRAAFAGGARRPRARSADRSRWPACCCWRRCVLMARIPVLERAFGQDDLARRHRLVGLHLLQPDGRAHRR